MESHRSKYEGISTYELAIMIKELELEIVNIKHEMQHRFAEELKVQRLKPSAPEIAPKPKRVVPITNAPRRSRLLDLLRAP